MNSFPHINCVSCNKEFLDFDDFHCYTCTRSKLRDDLKNLHAHLLSHGTEYVSEGETSAEEEEDSDDAEFINDSDESEPEEGEVSDSEDE